MSTHKILFHINIKNANIFFNKKKCFICSSEFLSNLSPLTGAMLNKLRCQAHI